MTRYTSTTEQDRREMLDAIGVGSLEDLFAEIPDGVRLKRPLDLPAGMSEQEVFDHLSELAGRNRHADGEVTFLGAGMYDHYVPALIDSILQRSEFLTPYTPYQPEISQGGLQVMFEFQTAISELTGLPVSNASVYEGPSAVAAAGYLAKLENGRTKLVTSRGLHPHSREALADPRRRLPHGGRRGAAERRRRHRRRGARRGGRRRHGRRVRAAAELPRHGRGPRRARPSAPRPPARCSSAPPTRCRSAS